MKLRLHLDELAVVSFDTTVAEAGKGTVFGEECTCPTACTCPGCDTCDHTCAYTCAGHTCDGNTCHETCAFTCGPVSCHPVDCGLSYRYAYCQQWP
jgi:hypothetical protein